MTISTLFNAELTMVDAARAFAYSVEPAWGENEWAVEGWSITGGSDAACEHGASEALHAMGFRFWTPVKTSRPASVPASGVTLPRQQFVMPYMQVFFNYGNPGILEDEFTRWATLNNVADKRRPVGHAWSAIISWAASYYAANPSYLINGGTSFELSEPTARAANMAKCVEWVLLNINEWGRCHFDPADGDTQDTDTVFAFANDVVDQVRQTVPNARLGLYAYAGHRAPASFPCPNLYVQVALGFNDLGLGYQELVRQWGLVVPEIALRAYGDIAAQDGWYPAYSTVTNSAYYQSQYPGFVSNGANGVNMETSGNWTKNAPGMMNAIRFWKTGTTTYADVLADMVPAIYGNDPKVTELFNLWGDPYAALSDYLLRDSCRIVDAMQDAPYKVEFQQYITVILRDRALAKMTTRDGTYMTALEQNLRWAWGIRNTGGLHSYAYTRQLANSNVTDNGRPDLNFASNPHWSRYPIAPSAQDYQASKAHLAILDNRWVGLDDQNLVEVDVSPTGQAAALLTPATDFTTLGVARFKFVGPGTVTVNYSASYLQDQVHVFRAGIHDVVAAGDAVTSWTDGRLYLVAFPQVRLDPSAAPGFRWAYLPRMSRGRVLLSSGSRITLTDAIGRKDISQNLPPFGPGMASPQSIRPGVLRVDNINTRGTHSLGNLNPFVSPLPGKQLMPRALAIREGLHA